MAHEDLGRQRLSGDSEDGQLPKLSTVDVAQLVLAANRGDRSRGITIETTPAIRAHLRMVSLSVLDELGSMGVLEAGKLKARLEGHDPADAPMQATLQDVAKSYELAQADIEDPRAAREARDMRLLAQASFGISLVRTVTPVLGRDARVLDPLITTAREWVNVTANLLPNHTFDALTDALHSAQTPPPIEKLT